MRALTVLLALMAVSATSNAYYRVCYYTNWAQYRPAGAKFFPEDIDPFLCTHIIYSFAKINQQNMIAMYEWNDDKMYVRFNNLKENNPELKTLLAVGGWNHESGTESPFSRMVRTIATRKVFIDSVKRWETCVRNWNSKSWIQILILPCSCFELDRKVVGTCIFSKKRELRDY